MKTLLQINSVVNTGSTGRTAEELGQMAKAEGYKSFIAYGRTARKSSSQLIRIGTDFDNKLHGLATRLFDRHCLASKGATKRFIHEIEKIKPDIIHLRNLHGYYLHIGVLFDYLKETQIPIVWTLHDCWAITGHCAHFDFMGCEKWKTQCLHCPQKKYYPASWMIDRSKKNYQLKKDLFTGMKRMTVVPVSHWLENIVRDSFLKDFSIKTIYNGIDVDVFIPQSNTEFFRKKYNLTDRIIMLSVATSGWGERKGLNDFIALSNRLDRDSRIVLVGLNAKQIKKLPSNMIGIPRTESLQEMSSIYSAADVFMNLSYEETFGKTTVEAMACGTPSVVYNVTACPEIVSKETSLVVEPGNINGLLQAIQTIKQNGKKHYAGACRKRAVKLFNKKDRYGEYLNLYNKIITV